MAPVTEYPSLHDNRSQAAVKRDAGQRTISECLRDYETARKGRYKASTWDAHSQLLERMREWIVHDFGYAPYIDDVDDKIMVRGFNRLRPPAYSASTFNNYRQYVGAFFTFCRGEVWLDINPMRHIDPLRVPKR